MQCYRMIKFTINILNKITFQIYILFDADLNIRDINS